MQTKDNIRTEGNLVVVGTSTLTGALTIAGAISGAAIAGTTGTFTGDIVAAGGHLMPFAFDQADATSSQTAVALTILGSDADLVGYPALRPGSVVGIGVTCEAARSAGTLTVDATIDGAATGLQAVLDDDPTTTAVTVQAKDLDAFAAAALIGVKVTTDADWAAGTTPSILVVVYVEM